MTIGRIPSVEGGIQPTIVDAKGDLIAATAADTVTRLPLGSDGQVLKVNTSTATGLEWAADSSGMTNPMTTTGDTIYSSSGSTPARLAIGSSGQVLTVSGGVPAWTTISTTPTFKGVRVRGSTTQSISNNTQTNILWPTESFDTDNFHSTTTNTENITIPTGLGGYYLVTATILWENNTTGIRSVYIQNTTPSNLVTFTQGASNSGADGLTQTVNTILNLTAGTTIRLAVFQNSGAARTVDRSESSLSLQYLGA